VAALAAEVAEVAEVAAFLDQVPAGEEIGAKQNRLLFGFLEAEVLPPAMRAAELDIDPTPWLGVAAAVFRLYADALKRPTVARTDRRRRTRNQVQRPMNRHKQFRAVTTRDGKLSDRYQATHARAVHALAAVAVSTTVSGSQDRLRLPPRRRGRRSARQQGNRCRGHQRTPT
jgi:hypothetical protein